MKIKRFVTAIVLGGTMGVATAPLWAQNVEKKSVPADQQITPSKPGDEQALPPRASESKSTGMSAQDIMKVQDALKAKGHNPGTSGAMDDKTRDAIRAFQKANNLALTGTVDEKTAAALGVNLSASKPGDKSTGANSTGTSSGPTEKSNGSTPKSSTK